MPSATILGKDVPYQFAASVVDPNRRQAAASSLQAMADFIDAANPAALAPTVALINGVTFFEDDIASGARGLLIRRNIADGDLAFFTTWCPARTGIDVLVKVEGHRWAIEDSFETAKNELGLDHNETRSWHGWHRHVALVMLAFAMTAAIRHHANLPTPQKTKA